MEGLEKPLPRELSDPCLSPCFHFRPPGQVFQPRGLSLEFPVLEVRAEDLQGADLFTRMGHRGNSRKEDVIIITPQKL